MKCIHCDCKRNLEKFPPVIRLNSETDCGIQNHSSIYTSFHPLRFLFLFSILSPPYSSNFSCSSSCYSYLFCSSSSCFSCSSFSSYSSSCFFYFSCSTVNAVPDAPPCMLISCPAPAFQLFFLLLLLFILVLYICFCCFCISAAHISCSLVLTVSSASFVSPAPALLLFLLSCSYGIAVYPVLLLRYCCFSCPSPALLLFLLSCSCVTAVPPVLFMRYCCSSCPASTLLLFLLSSSEASNIRVFTSNTETISGLGSMRRVILWFLCIYLSKGLALLQFILLYIFALL